MNTVSSVNQFVNKVPGVNYVNNYYSGIVNNIIKKVSDTMDNRIDLVVFGATGYTGQHVVQKLAEFSKEYEFSWAIAGRNQDGLKKSLKWASDRTELNLSKTKIIIANIKDDKSLVAMTKQCRVLLNCVGPYTLYGEQVIRACIETGTHHLDITGEPYFIQSIQYKYGKQAEDENVFISSACGFESIPADLGTLAVQDKFKGVLEGVYCYTYFDYKGSKPQKGATIHTGTWDSMLQLGYMESKRKKVHRKLHPNGFREVSKSVVHKFGNVYCAESLGPAHTIVSTTQDTLFDLEGRKPVPFQSYFTIGNIITAWIFYLSALFFFILAKSDLFIKILSKFPRLFTFGFVSKAGPREDELKHFEAMLVLSAEGYEDEKKRERKSLKLKITCRDPGYSTTATILVMAGIMIIKQKSLLPSKGGVYTPGALLHKTTILEDLSRQGLNLNYDPPE